MRALTAPLIGALLLTGCGGGSFEADDPAGYEACRLYAEAQGSDDPVVRMGLPLFEVGKHASTAKTGAIRDAVEPLSDAELQEQYGMPETWSVDDEALSAVCEENGVSIP
jgi:hypothetical protein